MRINEISPRQYSLTSVPSCSAMISQLVKIQSGDGFFPGSPSISLSGSAGNANANSILFSIAKKGLERVHFNDPKSKRKHGLTWHLPYPAPSGGDCSP